MRIYYDTEFVEDGRTIGLLSAAFVADDDAEYYAVVDDLNLVERASANPWLVANVLSSLPLCQVDTDLGWRWEWDENHPDYDWIKPREQVADEVKDFIGGYVDPQLWADYAAYDHVVLCQLWGRMIDLPEGVPMFTSDLRQEIARLGLTGSPAVPVQKYDEHNARDDARHSRKIGQFLCLGLT